MILTIRTDSPEAELSLVELSGEVRTAYTWYAHRQLAKELLAAIRGQLHHAKADWKDISGVLVFAGPGSFTGLRIGITVANTIAYAQNVPIVAAQGQDWLVTGLRRLKNQENDRLALPHYGSEPNITMPRK